MLIFYYYYNYIYSCYLSNTIFKPQNFNTKILLNKMNNSASASSKNNPPSTLDFYTVLHTLGSGSSSKVKLVSDPFTHSYYAAKIIKPTRQFPLFHYRSKLLSEVSCLHKISNKYIVKYYSHKESGSYISKTKGFYKCLYIILEYCPHGDLFNILKNGGLGLNLTLFLFHQIFSALKYCFETGCSHGDLKLENILIGEDYKVRLIDFALSSKTVKKNKVVGTERYLPPEARGKGAVDVVKADLFVAGILLFSLYTGSPPFNKSTEEDQLFWMLGEDKEQFWSIFESNKAEVKFSKEFKEIVQGMLEKDPEKRWGVKEVQESDWVLQGVNKEEAIGALKRVVYNEN